MGAIGSLLKPIQSKEPIDTLIGEIRRFVDRPVSELLVVQPDQNRREHIIEPDRQRRRPIHGGREDQEALRLLEERPFDCVVLDVNGPTFRLMP